MKQGMILSCILLSIFLCSCQIDGRNSVLVDLVSEQEQAPIITAVQIIVNDGEEEAFFEFEEPERVPIDGSDGRLAFVLDFAPQFAGTEVTYEIIGLQDGVNVLSSKKETAFIGRGLVQQKVEVSFCGDFKVNEFRNEECEDGNLIDGDNCDSNCTVTACGNGIASPGEFCYAEEPIILSNEAVFIASGDVDLDGDIDLVNVEPSGGPVNVFLNNGDESFTEGDSFPAGRLVFNRDTGMSLDDIDNDGDLDLIILHLFQNEIEVYLNNGVGDFPVFKNFPVNNELNSLVTADLNKDTFIDIITVNVLSDNISIFLNDGSGNFESRSDVVFETPDSIATGDIDNDGDLDLAMASRIENKIDLMLNDGNAQFSFIKSITTPTPTNVVLQDINGNGNLDLVATNFNNDTINFFINEGGGRFQLPENLESPLNANVLRDLKFGDFDSDNDFDLLIADFSNADSKQHVFLNDGSGRFQFKQTFNVNSHQVLVEDLNEGGIPELISNSSVFFSTP